MPPRLAYDNPAPLGLGCECRANRLVELLGGVRFAQHDPDAELGQVQVLGALRELAGAGDRLLEAQAPREVLLGRPAGLAVHDAVGGEVLGHVDDGGG